MKDIQLRWDIRVELEDLNAETATLELTTKKNFGEVGE